MLNRNIKITSFNTGEERDMFTLKPEANSRLMNTKSIIKFESLEDFIALPEGTKIHSIINGKLTHYVMVKENPKCTGYFILLSAGDYTSALVVQPNFDAKRNCWFTNYNSKEVGEIIISQTECLIESYKQIFFHE